jgi:pectate lyase
MKRLLFLTIFLLAIVYTYAQAITISESVGWLESAYVKWQPVENAEGYHVYFSGEGISDQKIDDQLIRNYDTYVRADVPGLKAGTYTIKVVPVISGEEGEGTVTAPLEVKSHDRSGFAFSNGRNPGAYKADGTPKNGAVILYITENTKNKVSIDVTGANENPCTGLETILEGFKKGKDTRPLIIRLVGQITDPDYTDKGDIVIENDNNASSYITIEGVGDDAVADGWGIRVKNASNIEIRNIGLMNCNSSEGDDIGLQQNNDYIWVHHCDFFYGDAGSDADQVKGDGALDCKKSTYVTFSFNHFWDSGKSNLLGLSEGTTAGLYITYHHNWYDHSDSRHPRVRYYSAHVYNNYYDGNAKYGVGSTMGSSVFVEANYFRNCKYPMLISMQGSDVFDESTQANDYKDKPTFSKEDGGNIKAFGNYMTGQKRFVAYGASGYPDATVDFDAYIATSRDETLSSSIVSAYGANTYNNFDTDPDLMYTYSADSPETAKEKVLEFAGRMNGGDFNWAFNNATDDASYEVNTGLKAALVDYRTSLVSVQGDSTAQGGDDPGGSDNPGGDTLGDLIQNFTLSGKTSTFYNITGNLSDSKGTVNYNGLTLTQCLKIESTTNISFTTTDEATLTLVFNSDFSGKIKVNNVSYNATSGILSIIIQAGSYEITKAETANLYYMGIAYNNSRSTDNASIYLSDAHSPTIYPNPVIDILTINSSERVERVEIYSLTGTLVKNAGSNTSTINMNELSHGSYLIRIVTEQGVFKQTIIKK